MDQRSAITKAKEEFQSRCVGVGILDAIGNEVIVDPYRWHHIAFKQDEGDANPKATRETWRPDRARFIPWIPAILMDPWEIRPNKVPGRLSYLLQYPSDPKADDPGEIMYFAVTEFTGNLKAVSLVTAYPVRKRAYWNEARQVGACLYPPEKTKAVKNARK